MILMIYNDQTITKHHVLFLVLGNLFITYSIDTAEYIPSFVSFLITQGFRPAVSI